MVSATNGRKVASPCRRSPECYDPGLLTGCGCDNRSRFEDFPSEICVWRDIGVNAVKGGERTASEWEGLEKLSKDEL